MVWTCVIAGPGRTRLSMAMSHRRRRSGGAIAAPRSRVPARACCCVDRARFPRDKLCGDTLNPGALALLDHAGLRGQVERCDAPLDGMLITGNAASTSAAPTGDGLVGRALTRRVLDSAAGRRGDRRRRAIPGRRARARAR